MTLCIQGLPSKTRLTRSEHCATTVPFTPRLLPLPVTAPQCGLAPQPAKHTCPRYASALLHTYADSVLKAAHICLLINAAGHPGARQAAVPRSAQRCGRACGHPEHSRAFLVTLRQGAPSDGWQLCTRHAACQARSGPTLRGAGAGTAIAGTSRGGRAMSWQGHDLDPKSTAGCPGCACAHASACPHMAPIWAQEAYHGRIQQWSRGWHVFSRVCSVAKLPSGCKARGAPNLAVRQRACLRGRAGEPPCSSGAGAAGDVASPTPAEE